MSRLMGARSQVPSASALGPLLEPDEIISTAMSGCDSVKPGRMALMRRPTAELPTQRTVPRTAGSSM